MNTSSVWFDKQQKWPKFPSVEKAETVDVAIVGGGITGMLCAYFLAKTGKKVAVFERYEIGGGETSYSTAFLSAYIDLGFEKLIKTLGLEKAQLIAAACRSSIETFAKIVTDEKLDCDFVRLPFTFYAVSADDETLAQAELKAGQQLDAALAAVEKKSLPFPTFGGWQMTDQATFNPRAFVKELARVATKHGAQIFENSAIENISTDSPARLMVNGHPITASTVIAATHTPLNSQKLFSAALRPDTTYVIAGTFPTGKVQVGLYIDSARPYHYLRVTKQTKNVDQFVFGGEDHWTGDTHSHGDAFAKLEAEFKSRFSDQATVTHQWGGQVFESLDGLPYIGCHPFHRQQLFATGYAGDGLLWSPISAQLLADLVTGTHNNLVDLLTPRRWRGWPTLLEHGQEILKSLIDQKFSHHRLLSEAELNADSGQIFQIHGQSKAVYKDNQNHLHYLSAKCTHLGCDVQWNDALKSWDCPCHGSRFTPTGDVMSGPANKPLIKVKK